MTQCLLQQVDYAYGDRLILQDITLTAAAGELMTVIGPSGCGKTTLLNLLAGLQQPSSGSVAIVPSSTAYVFQDPRLFPWLTVVENIAVGLKQQNLSDRQQRQVAYALAEQVGLAAATQLYPAQLSGGMKQRVNLARALAIKPRLLLLDEPLSALDIGTRQQLQQLVGHWVHDQQIMAILVTHDLAEAVLMGDRLLVLSPCPARIVYHWSNARPFNQRDPAYVYRVLTELQAQPTVSASFQLRTATIPTSWRLTR